MRDRGLFEKVPGSGVWWICYFDAEHRRRREKAGTKSMARNLYHKRKTEALKGRKLPETLRGRHVAFSELCDDTLAHVKTHNEGRKIDEWRIGQLKAQFGSGPAEIPIDALRSWFAEHEWSGGTYNRFRTVLSAIYRIGMENKKVSSNPAKLLKRKRESDGRVRFLNQIDADEESRLRKVIAERFPEHLPEFDIALNTGMRRSEQYRRISWESVDFKRRDLFVPESKNGRSRHIPLNDAALDAFKTLHGRTGGNGPIFASQRDGEALAGPRHWFEDALADARVNGFTWHDCRHTFASRLVIKGVPLRAVADLLGHRTIQMTMRYAHLAQGDKLAAVQELNSYTVSASATKGATSENGNDSNLGVSAIK